MTITAKRLCKLANSNLGFPQWRPVLIEDWEAILLQRINDKLSTVPQNKDIRKNIAYNLQYLEYLNRTVYELKLTTVLQTQTYKFGVITAMSIIEALFFCLLKEKGMYSTTDWKELKKVVGNPFKSGKTDLRADFILLKRLSAPVEVEMKLDSMIKKVQAKHLLSSSFAHYGQLKNLRRLRNKIHIHSIEKTNGMDTDYYNFNAADFDTVRVILWQILSDMFKFTADDVKKVAFLSKAKIPELRLLK